VVVITGSGFAAPGVTDVEFFNGVAADFQIISDTEIWATVPGGATNGPITLTDSVTSADTPAFTVTTNAGGCAPAVASFTPTCGTTGTIVTITGTNLLQFSGDGTNPAEGADVRFAPYAANATHTGVAENPTTLSVNVPASATDGPIRVTTFAPGAGGQVFSTTNFDVVTDLTECGVTPTPTEHARNVTLRLKGALRMKGKVNATDDFTDCENGVSVKLQRKKKGGGWKTLKTVTTNDVGAYSSKVKNRPGRYRSVAPRTTVGEDVCLKDISPIRRN
jgi:hypothetical protein